MPNEPNPLAERLSSGASDLTAAVEVIEAAEAVLADARMRNEHRVTDLAGTVQVGTDVLQALSKALRSTA